MLRSSASAPASEAHHLPGPLRHSGRRVGTWSQPADTVHLHQIEDLNGRKPASPCHRIVLSGVYGNQLPLVSGPETATLPATGLPSSARIILRRLVFPETNSSPR